MNLFIASVIEHAKAKHTYHEASAHLRRIIKIALERLKWDGVYYFILTAVVINLLSVWHYLLSHASSLRGLSQSAESRLLSVFRCASLHLAGHPVRFAHDHTSNNTDPKHVEPAMHEIEQMRIKER
jgi:hypothetical protein